MKLASILASALFFVSFSFSQTLLSQFYGVNGGSSAGTVRAVATAGNTLYIGGTFTEVNFPCGNAAFLDGTTGDADRFFPKFDDRVLDIISDNNGGWYVGGMFTHTQGYPIKYLAHINANHTVDTSFNLSVNSFVNALALLDSTLYIGGVFDSIKVTKHKYIGAINVNSQQVTSWDPNVDNIVTAIAVVGNAVYIGGYFNSIGGQSHMVLALLDRATGIPDTSFQFGTGGPSGTSHAERFISSNGKLYVGGIFSTIDNYSRYNLCAINIATKLVDPTWNPGNINVNAINDMVIAGNTLYVAGYFTNIGGAARNNLAALDLTTGNATSWNPNPNDQITSLTMFGDKLVIGGYFTTIGVKSQSYLAMVDTSTGLAASWNPNLNERVYTLFTSGNSVFVGGLFASVNRVPRTNLAAIDAVTGKVKSSWTANAGSTVYALAISKGKLIVGGSFTNIGNSSVSYLATLDTATGATIPFLPSAGGTVYSIFPYGTRIYIGGGFSSVTGGSRNGLAAFDAASGKLLSWNPTQDYGGGLAFAGLGGTIYVAGFFNTINGAARNYLAAFDTTTDQLLPWDPNANQMTQSLAAANGLVYLGGDFTTVGGLSRKKLAAVDAVTGVPNGFNVSADYTVYTLAIAGTSLYAGGIFTNINGLPRQNVAIIDLLANAPTSWSPNNIGQYVYSIALAEQRVYIGGFFASINHITSNSVGVLSIPTLTLKKPAFALFGSKNIYFGKIKIGTSKDTTVAIFNSGDDTLKIKSFTSSDTSFIVTQKQFSVLPQQTVLDSIRFTPLKADSIVSVCLVTSNSLSSIDTLRFSGAGVATARIADIHHNRDTLNFGLVNLGNSKDTTFIVSTTGNDTLHGTAVVATNTRFVPKKTSFLIAPSGSFTDSLRFTADSVGTFKALVLITSDATNKITDTIVVIGVCQKVTSVDSRSIVSGAFSLSQNYPNPFNPSTLISYQLPVNSHITMKVYDVIGREVATLVDEVKEAGSYEVKVDASRLSSGVYFYRMQAENYVEMKKMVLMK